MTKPRPSLSIKLSAAWLSLGLALLAAPTSPANAAPPPPAGLLHGTSTAERTGGVVQCPAGRKPVHRYHVGKVKRTFKIVWSSRDFNGGPKQELNKFVFGYGKRQTNFARQTWSIDASAEVGATGLTRIFTKLEGKISGRYFSDQYNRTTTFSFQKETHRVTRYRGQNVYFRGVTYWQAPWHRTRWCGVPYIVETVARGQVRGNLPQEFGNIACRFTYKNPMASYVKRHFC